MATAATLVAPYASVMFIFRWRRIAASIASHTTVTLPIGWGAVLALLAALLGVWSLPVGVLVLCAALSGLAMITPGDDGGDDGPGDDDDDDPPPGLDWDAFDRARRRWDRFGRPGPRSPRSRTL